MKAAKEMAISLRKATGNKSSTDKDIPDQMVFTQYMKIIKEKDLTICLLIMI